jgi:hypothetical protein
MPVAVGIFVEPAVAIVDDGEVAMDSQSSQRNFREL